MDRRSFIKKGGATAGFLTLPNSRSAFGTPANSRLNIAQIGVAGRGGWFINTMPNLGTHFAALCDVNGENLKAAARKFPEATTFSDYREMLTTLKGKLDGVIVAIPDHSHAPACAMAMKMGIPVFCEKPLTRTVEEARALRDLAKKSGVATQMGNQGTSSAAFQRCVEIIEDGVIGDIREVIAWNASGGPGSRKPVPSPDDVQETPPYLDWDLWLGPAEERPFHQHWRSWHAWRDFGTGQLGNWAVHTTNLAFKAFRIAQLWDAAAPEGDFPQGRNLRVSARVSEIVHATFPKWEVVEFESPPRAGLGKFKMTWVNGRAPDMRDKAETLLGRKLDWGDAGEKRWKDHAGIVIAGANGRLWTNGHNMKFALYPEDKFADQLGPPRRSPRSPGHEGEWLRAIKGGEKACSDFGSYGALLTEFVLLGNVATRVEGAIEYDPLPSRIVNNAEADDYRLAKYREGWKL